MNKSEELDIIYKRSMRKPLENIGNVYDRMGIRKISYPKRIGSSDPIEVHVKTFHNFNIYEFRKFMEIVEEEYSYRQEISTEVEDMWKQMGERRKMMDKGQGE